jgi:hypothetical protein
MSAEQINILECRLARLRNDQIVAVDHWGVDCDGCEDTIYQYTHYLAVLLLDCEDARLSCPKITGEVCIHNGIVSDGQAIVSCAPVISHDGPTEPDCVNPLIIPV